MNKIRKLWSISGIVYREMVFYTSMIQQGYGSVDKEVVEKIIKNRWGYWILKGIVGMIIAITAATSIFAAWNILKLTNNFYNALAASIYLAFFLVFSLFFIFFMAIFQATSLSSPEVFIPLSYLNLSKDEISKIIYFTIFRIFDLPITLTGISILLTSIIVSWNPFFVLSVFFSYAITMALVISLVVNISFRYFRGFTKPETSKKKSVFKALLLFFYTIIFSTLYLIPTVLINYIGEFTNAIVNSSYLNKLLYSAIPIISFATLTSFMMALQNVPLEFVCASSLSAIFVIIVTYSLFRATVNKVTEIAFSPIELGVQKKVGQRFVFKKRGRLLSLLLKDLKLAYRNPNYSLTLFSGPGLLLVYYILWKTGGFSETFIYAITQAFIIFVLLLAPISIGMEGEGIRVLLSLPIDEREIIVSKSLLYILSYVIYSVSAIFVLLSISSPNLYVYNLLIATIGMSAAINRLVRKTWEVFKKGESIEKFRANITYLLYVIFMAIIYYFVPLTILTLYSYLPSYSQYVLVAYLVIQLIYLFDLYRLYFK